MVVALILLAIICPYGLRDHVESADLIVVLGNQVTPAGEPSTRLRIRLDRAVELYREGQAPRILVSGGIGREGVAEGTVMRDYLVRYGIPATAILVDNRGNNTYLTARHTRDLLAQEQASSVIIVSHYYHLLRCALAFQKCGVGTIYHARAKLQPEWWEPYSLLRECPALVYYLFRSDPHEKDKEKHPTTGESHK